MASLYERVGQMVANWYGQDAAAHRDPYAFAQTVVDMVLDEVRRNGIPPVGEPSDNCHKPVPHPGRMTPAA